MAHDQNLIAEVLARITDNRPDLFTGAASDIAGEAETDSADGSKPADDPLPPLRPVVIDDEEDAEYRELEEFGREESWHNVPGEEDDV
ncbi:MAG: hypothetical protein QM488_04660 [Rhizobiaceae bacterium]